MRRAQLLLIFAAVSAANAATSDAAGIRTEARQKAWTPAPVAGHRIRASPGSPRVGTSVRLPTNGIREFAGPRAGYALVTIGNATYPVKTVDGGRSWHVAGPRLHQNAAQGGAGVGAIQAASASVALAWGGITPDGVVDWTTDGGQNWFTARFPGVVLYVGTEGGTLVANVYGSFRQGTTTHSGLWAYRENAGGTWTYVSTIA